MCVHKKLSVQLYLPFIGYSFIFHCYWCLNLMYFLNADIKSGLILISVIIVHTYISSLIVSSPPQLLLFSSFRNTCSIFLPFSAKILFLICGSLLMWQMMKVLFIYKSIQNSYLFMVYMYHFKFWERQKCEILVTFIYKQIYLFDIRFNF